MHTLFSKLGFCLECMHTAERRLLHAMERQARRHGLKPHQIITWVRRKAGPDLVVWRTLHDGSLGCATPCILCQKEVLRYDFRIHCSQSGKSWFSGRLDEAGAPECKLTTSQRRLMFNIPSEPTPKSAKNNVEKDSHDKRGRRSSLKQLSSSSDEE